MYPFLEKKFCAIPQKNHTAIFTGARGCGPWNFELLWSLDAGVWMFRLSTFVRLCQPMSAYVNNPSPHPLPIRCSMFGVQCLNFILPLAPICLCCLYFLLFKFKTIQINPSMTKYRPRTGQK